MNWLTDSIREFIHRGDRLLLTLCLLASGFGMVLIYSATRYMNHSAGAALHADPGGGHRSGGVRLYRHVLG
ncbi:hypothetical protein M5E87_23285 [Flavonifractor plautii]|nr:hypothetical protein M5E87_23285 [Flavonifractor plautii]